MGHTKRTYEIVERGNINDPPKTSPVLSDKGHIIDPDDLLIFNKDTDQMKKVDHYRVTFKIKHFNQSQLRFTPNKSDVLWVKKGTGKSSCPTSPCDDLPDTVWVDDMDDDGEWIDVINMDMAKVEFWFTLNLVEKSNPTSTTYVPVDPGGGNQNGGSPGSDFTSTSALTMITVGFCAGLVAFYGAGLFLAA